MSPLFSPSSLVVLESLAFTDTLFAFDFDGTLAPIVREPAAARMPARTAALLQRLSRLAPVAIISGRSVADLRRRLDFEPRYLVGNHGLEGLEASTGSLGKAEAVCRAWLRSLEKAGGFSPAVQVEDKSFSLALHYRRSRRRKEARAQILSRIGSLRPAPRVIEGKLVYNLLPPGAPHKGAAILDLMRSSGCANAFYIGDDDTDEDVFRMTRGPGEVLTVRVGRKRDSRAHYFIPAQRAIDRLLSLLVAFHSESSRGGQRHA